jgi:hypothetical protein
MLSYLREKGFIPYATIPDINNPKYYNWRFKNTPELKEAIDEYIKGLNKDK